MTDIYLLIMRLKKNLFEKNEVNPRFFFKLIQIKLNF